jgi:hypothetical protein
VSARAPGAREVDPRLPRGVLGALSVYAALTGANLRSQMQYRFSFAMLTAFDFLIIVSDLAPVYLMVRYFGNLEGWSFAELALLYGMVGLSWGIVETALQGFADFGSYLVQGDLDRWLLRPRSIVLQVAAYRFEARKVGRILQAGLVLAIAVVVLGLPPGGVAWALFGVAGGVLFFTGIVMLGDVGAAEHAHLRWQCRSRLPRVGVLSLVPSRAHLRGASGLRELLSGARCAGADRERGVARVAPLALALRMRRGARPRHGRVCPGSATLRVHGDLRS